MTRLVLGLVGVAIVALAVWAALPSRVPAVSPEVAGPASAAPGPPASRAPAQPDAPPAAPALAPTGDATTDAAIASCVGAQLMVMQQRAQRGGPAPAGQPSDAAVVSRACAPLYKQPACRSAMLKYDEPPAELRSSTVLQACARAYCPSLKEPKPDICGHVDNVPQDIQQFQEWAQLRTAILTREIGPAATQIVTNPPRRPSP